MKLIKARQSEKLDEYSCEGVDKCTAGVAIDGSLNTGSVTEYSEGDARWKGNMVEPLQVKKVEFYLNVYTDQESVHWSLPGDIANASSAAFHKMATKKEYYLLVRHIIYKQPHIIYKQPNFRVELRDAQNEAQSCYEVAKYFWNRGSRFYNFILKCMENKQRFAKLTKVAKNF